ncbi:MAG: TetR/AcrR family transcriptional regulator [Spirochaetaceae bacterium]
MKNPNSKDKLISATIEAIYTNGLNSVTTAKIAKQAKLSEAMIYRHFGNKDEMIIASYMEIKTELNDSVKINLSDEMYFNQTSYSIWLSHVDFFIDNPKKLRVLNQVEHSNLVTDTIRENCLELSQIAISFFEKGIKNNMFKPMHIEVAIALYFSPILSIAESIIRKRIIKSEVMLKQLYDSTMLGLKL